MADDEHGAFVVGEFFFEQFQRVDIKIVGRLVEHQHVGFFGEMTRQQQAISFTTGQRFHLRLGTLWRKQKVGEIGHHVGALGADLDPVAAWRNKFAECGLLIKPVAHLVEVRNLHVHTGANLAAVGLNLSEDEFQ